MQELRKSKILNKKNHFCDTVPLFLRAMVQPHTIERIEIPAAALPPPFAQLLHFQLQFSIQYVVVSEIIKMGLRTKIKDARALWTNHRVPTPCPLPLYRRDGR
jgi:hypothetical protein